LYDDPVCASTNVSAMLTFVHWARGTCHVRAYDIHKCNFQLQLVRYANRTGDFACYRYESTSVLFCCFLSTHITCFCSCRAFFCWWRFKCLEDRLIGG
jgi:hypothetical protein